MAATRPLSLRPGVPAMCRTVTAVGRGEKLLSREALGLSEQQGKAPLPAETSPSPGRSRDGGKTRAGGSLAPWGRVWSETSPWPEPRVEVRTQRAGTGGGDTGLGTMPGHGGLWGWMETGAAPGRVGAGSPPEPLLPGQEGFGCCSCALWPHGQAKGSPGTRADAVSDKMMGEVASKQQKVALALFSNLWFRVGSF